MRANVLRVCLMAVWVFPFLFNHSADADYEQCNRAQKIELETYSFPGECNCSPPDETISYFMNIFSKYDKKFEHYPDYNALLKEISAKRENYVIKKVDKEKEKEINSHEEKYTKNYYLLSHILELYCIWLNPYNKNWGPFFECEVNPIEVGEKYSVEKFLYFVDQCGNSENCPCFPKKSKKNDEVVQYRKKLLLFIEEYKDKIDEHILSRDENYYKFCSTNQKNKIINHNYGKKESNRYFNFNDNEIKFIHNKNTPRDPEKERFGGRSVMAGDNKVYTTEALKLFHLWRYASDHKTKSITVTNDRSFVKFLYFVDQCSDTEKCPCFPIDYKGYRHTLSRMLRISFLVQNHKDQIDEYAQELNENEDIKGSDTENKKESSYGHHVKKWLGYGGQKERDKKERKEENE